MIASRLRAAGSNGSTSGRILVRRKWSGQDVPSAASGQEIARIDEFQHGRRVGEMSDLALAGRNALADGGQQRRRGVAPLGRRQRLRARAAEGFPARIGAEPGRGLVDRGQRRPVAILGGRPPGEQAVAAEHDALVSGVGLRHRPELQAEVETRPLPRQKAELAAENLARQRLGVLAGRDRDHGVGVNVIDMQVGNERVQRRVDRGRARIEVEGAMIEQRDHLVLMGEAAVNRLEAEELVEIEGRKAVELHRPDVAARALDPQNSGRRAGQRIRLHDLGGRVAAAEIGDAKIAAEQVGSVEQAAGLVERGGVGVVPQIGQRGVEAGMIAAHGSFLSMSSDFERSLCKRSRRVNDRCDLRRRR